MDTPMDLKQLTTATITHTPSPFLPPLPPSLLPAFRHLLVVSLPSPTLLPSPDHITQQHTPPTPLLMCWLVKKPRPGYFCFGSEGGLRIVSTHNGTATVHMQPRCLTAFANTNTSYNHDSGAQFVIPRMSTVAR